MLSIKKQHRYSKRTGLMSGLAICLFGGGLYMLSLVSAPIIMPLVNQPLDPSALAKPQAQQKRLIIPKIGVDISYAKGEESLKSGAWWRHPERGNPAQGGNFILAAHRFEIQPTPQATWQKSPFYNIDELAIGDEIIVDYQGKRYGYKVDTIKNVPPTQVEVEAPSKEAKLTLYSCELGGASADRLVLTAQPMGQVYIK